MELKPYQGCAWITHWFPESQQQEQAPTPRVQLKKRKPGRSPRVSPIEFPVETTEQRKPGRNTMITPSEVIMETQEKMKLGRSLRVVPSKMPLLTQEEINHMVPTIKIATNNMATQIEDETLPWYFFNVVIYPDTGNILQWKYLIQ